MTVTDSVALVASTPATVVVGGADLRDVTLRFSDVRALDDLIGELTRLRNAIHDPLQELVS